MGNDVPANCNKQYGVGSRQRELLGYSFLSMQKRKCKSIFLQEARLPLSEVHTGVQRSGVDKPITECIGTSDNRYRRLQKIRSVAGYAKENFLPIGLVKHIVLRLSTTNASYNSAEQLMTISKRGIDNELNASK
jgi:hypothetical protein